MEDDFSYRGIAVAVGSDSMAEVEEVTDPGLRRNYR